MNNANTKQATKTYNRVSRLLAYGAPTMAEVIDFLSSGDLSWSQSNGLAHYFALAHGLIAPAPGGGKYITTWSGKCLAGVAE